MLPTVGNDTPKILWYTAEVVGRVLGIASMPTLIPEAPRRDALTISADKINASVQALSNALAARLVFEYVDQRIAVGKGRGVDRGFDAFISSTSETVRTSLPDRTTTNPDYRAIFPNGAEAYTSPTIHEDENIATDLRQALTDSKLAVKADLIASLDLLLPIVGPAAAAVRDGDKQVNTLFQAELTARKVVIDTLWEERKTIESTLGRAGRGLARFIFFDFRKGGGDMPDSPPAPAAAQDAPAPAAPAPDAPKDPA